MQSKESSSFHRERLVSESQGKLRVEKSETGFYSRTLKQRVDKTSTVEESSSNQARETVFRVAVSEKVSRRKISFVAKSQTRTLFLGIFESFGTIVTALRSLTNKVLFISM